MFDLRELYQQVIIDHGRKPRNFYTLDAANHKQKGYNPLCGDEITVYLQEKDGIIQDASFQGCGCAISMASASLLTEALKGKSIQAFQELFDSFHGLLTGAEDTNSENLGKLKILSGVCEYPSRIKCAVLSWHAVKAALFNEENGVSTE